MHKSLILILTFLFTSPVVAEPLLGDDAETVPIFDVHLHYNEPAWGPFPPETVFALFDRSRIPIALVSSTPESGTIRLWNLAPSRIVPELRPYYEDWDSSNWMSNPDVSNYLTEHLAKYPHEGVGEFHVHTLDEANLDLLESIAHEAAQRNIPLHIHSGAEPVQFLFDVAPGVTVVWAHAGMTSQPAEISEMMDRYPRLYADTSMRNGDIISSRGLDPDWEALLIRHSDRFMIGTDTWVNSQWERYDWTIAASRLWLAKLPKSVGEKIAHGNAERLFKREAAESLIGQR